MSLSFKVQEKIREINSHYDLIIYQCNITISEKVHFTEIMFRNACIVWESTTKRDHAKKKISSNQLFGNFFKKTLI